ncbi:MAG: isoaspartyl peptidase/L-asparaginase [Rubripirellula sp.]
MIRILVLLVTFLGFIFMPFLTSSGDEKPNWAIVIHGGAGSDPQKWNDAKTKIRETGLHRALTAGRDALANGGNALDTVELVIRILEDDAAFNAGRGAVLTKEGKVELDASIMDGKTGACGAVAGVTATRNPINLARLVMTQTPHVLLAGKGANQFAEQQKVPLVTPDYFLSKARFPENEPHYGTVGCAVLDSNGNLAAGTSTGGTSKKLPGRVGDSPIVGAGTYAANDTCAVSGTGVGEEYIRNSVAYDVAARMRYANESIEEAVTIIMQQTLQVGVGGIIALSKDGKIVMQHNTPGMSCGAADSSGRFETHLVLKNGGAPPPGTTADATKSTTVETEITDVLLQQVEDWNQGDIDSFMKPYWNSDQLTFSSGGKITRGYAKTLQGYKQRYPDAKAMGTLTFEKLEFQTLGSDAMQVLGTWKLARDDKPMEGRFTLVLRKFPEGWKIIHDHTSKKPEEKSENEASEDTVQQ